MLQYLDQVRVNLPVRGPVVRRPLALRSSDERMPRLRRAFPNRFARVALAWPLQSTPLDCPR